MQEVTENKTNEFMDNLLANKDKIIENGVNLLQSGVTLFGHLLDDVTVRGTIPVIADALIPALQKGLNISVEAKTKIDEYLDGDEVKAIFNQVEDLTDILKSRFKWILAKHPIVTLQLKEAYTRLKENVGKTEVEV